MRGTVVSRRTYGRCARRSPRALRRDPELLQAIVAGRRGNTGQYEARVRLWELAPNPVDIFVVVFGADHY